MHMKPQTKPSFATTGLSGFFLKNTLCWWRESHQIDSMTILKSATWATRVLKCQIPEDTSVKLGKFGAAAKSHHISRRTSNDLVL